MEGIEVSAGDPMPSYNIGTTNSFEYISDEEMSSDSQLPFEQANNKRERKRRRVTNNRDNSTPKEAKVTTPIIKAKSRINNYQNC